MDTYGFILLVVGVLMWVFTRKNVGWNKFAFFLIGAGLAVIVASVMCYRLCLDAAAPFFK